MKRLISGYLKGKVIIPLFIAAGIIYTIMLTITIPKVMDLSGGMKIPDMMPAGYNASYVNGLMAALGQEGRYAYLFNQIPLDMVYPALFGISLCLIMAYFLKRLKKTDGLLSISILPLFSGLFDYCENIGLIIILKTYPGNPDILSEITNVFSILKSTTTTISFVILIIIIIIFLFRKKHNPL